MVNARCIILICLLAAFMAKATVIDVSPGNLASELEAQTFPEENMTLHGAIDARDFPTLSELSNRVVSLDISGLEIRETRLQRPDGYGKSYYEAWELPEYLFFQSKVKEVSLPHGLLFLPEGLFGAAEIEKVVIPSTVRTIEDYAFYGASSLREVEGPATLETIGSNAFKDTAIRSLDVGTVAKYKDYALAGMTELREVRINPAASFGKGVLMDCANLNQINGMPKDVPELMAALSSNLSPGRYVEKAEHFGAYSFASGATVWLNLSENVVGLEDGVFANATSLASIDAKNLGDRVPYVTEKTFEGVEISNVELYVDEAAAELWRAHPVWGLFDIRTGQNSVAETESDAEPVISIKGTIIAVEGNGWRGEVNVFSLNGEHLYKATCEDVLEIDSSRWSGQMLIVSAGGRSKVILNGN